METIKWSILPEYLSYYKKFESWPFTLVDGLSPRYPSYNEV
jgi:hypothetical protein